jgi:hypothetical protein
MEWLERIGGMTNIVVVEIALLHQDEAVPDVETIRGATTQRPDAHSAALSPSITEHTRQSSGTNAFALVARMDVQMVE